MAGEKSGNIDEVLGRYVNFQRLAFDLQEETVRVPDLSDALVSMVVTIG